MDNLSLLNQAMTYIDEHLDDDMDYERVLKIAGCSEYHFKRMFSFLSGMSLSEYVRRRRLSLAAFDLKDRNLRILDIALKYRYESAESFSRAFRALHGCLPSKARTENIQLKTYPKITFQLSIHGGTEMKYRMVEKEAFTLIGIKKRVPIVFKGINPEIARMAQSLTLEKILKLKSISDVEPKGIISASNNFSEGRMEEKGELDHYLGVLSTLNHLDDFEHLEVKQGTWAVFESIGPFPDTLQTVWGRIYAEWFPSSNYEINEGPELVWHESPDTSLENYRSEIWIPVQKKTLK